MPTRTYLPLYLFGIAASSWVTDDEKEKPGNIFFIKNVTLLLGVQATNAL